MKGVKRENTYHLCGFDDETVEDAVKKHFTKYKIKSRLTYSALERFREPIFLKLYCELKNPSKKENVSVRLEDETTFEIFDKYLEQINEHLVSSKSFLRPNEPFVQTSLRKIGEYLWDNNSRDIPIDTYYSLIDIPNWQ